MLLLRGTLLASFAMSCAVMAQAQPVTDRNISIGITRAIIDGALEQCEKDGYRVVVAIVDRAGHLRSMMAHDGTHPHNAELARRKAYTARTFRQTTTEFQVRTERPESSGLRVLTDTVWTGGGVPIKFNDETIGGVGVSVAPGGPRDEICAQAGIAKAADQLK
ncbi:MAG: heme-binding protein [Xanthobacteraceae bacterium]